MGTLNWKIVPKIKKNIFLFIGFSLKILIKSWLVCTNYQCSNFSSSKLYTFTKSICWYINLSFIALSLKIPVLWSDDLAYFLHEATLSRMILVCQNKPSCLKKITQFLFRHLCKWYWRYCLMFVSMIYWALHLWMLSSLFLKYSKTIYLRW